jgi:hypothetical protein
MDRPFNTVVLEACLIKQFLPLGPAHAEIPVYSARRRTLSAQPRGI